LIPSKKNKIERFVVIDIGLGRVSLAVFDSTESGPKFVGVGRRSFTTPDTLLDAALEATDALGAVVDELPRTAVVGVCGGSLQTLTTVAKYTRDKPNQPIDKAEIANVLKKVSGEEKPGYKVFYSTVTGASVDGSKVTNPTGVKGEKVEVGCFIAYKKESELTTIDQIIDELEIKPERIVPTPLVVCKMLGDKIPEKSLLLRVGQNSSEASFVENRHLTKVVNFGLGFDQLEFYNFAIESLLESQKSEERPNYIWLYSDTDEVNLVDVTEKIAEGDWKKKFALKQDLKVERSEAENNFGAFDMGLLSLSLEEIIG
ncbi:MAG TPA: hypothetical protein VLE47_03820, partial [Candidatus Saccharimonadales bacterium]|nr:hypothetical protein [Candidatus Saccharimonadales bacterium]